MRHPTQPQEPTHPDKKTPSVAHETALRIQQAWLEADLRRVRQADLDIGEWPDSRPAR